jgi:hypothetical protein
MRKTTALIAGAVGYVLGARAGRERYEQIRTSFERLRSNPKVQQTARSAADTAKGAAPVVKDKLSSAAETATQKVHSDSSSNGVNLEDSGTTSTSSTSSPNPGDSSYPQG